MLKKWGLFIGPVLFFITILLPGTIISEQADGVLAVALWMIVWWITEAVHIAVTALLPLLLFPILNVAPMESVSQNYGHPIIFLFFGGFILALGLQKVNLHRRIALNIVKLTGTSPERVILGFMIATAFMSMWISNTASTVVMLPIALSVIQLLVDDEDGFTKKDKNFALNMMLGIAIAANAGGIATIIGTPPNSVLIALLESEYEIEIGFFQWMQFGLPFSILFIFLAYLVMVKWVFPCKDIQFSRSAALIHDEINKMGAMKRDEKQVLVIFIVTMSLWISRGFIQKLLPDFPINDTLISIFGAFAMFAIPTSTKKRTFVLDWKDTEKLSWGILLLFGGGLALASGMKSSGIVDLVTKSIADSNWGVYLIVTSLIILMIFMTELMSNVALVTVLAPVIAGIAIGLNIPMLQLLIPVTMAASCAFMLPMATPPNAIVFASGHVKVSQMAKIGFILNIIAAILLMLYYFTIIPLFFAE
ncbi:MAG: SLC13 family permease [Crocinitomicaceae bacterium]